MLSNLDKNVEPIGTNYKIQQWSGLIVDGNQNPLPLIYIKPDANFLSYAKDNGFVIKLTVLNTGSNYYDGKVFTGTVNSSADVPNCRPNFYKQTGLYTITLQSLWEGYPINMGEIYLEELPKIEESNFAYNKYHNTNVLKNIREPYQHKTKGLSSLQIFWILLSIFFGIPFLILITILIVKMTR